MDSFESLVVVVVIFSRHPASVAAIAFYAQIELMLGSGRWATSGVKRGGGVVVVRV